MLPRKLGWLLQFGLMAAAGCTLMAPHLERPTLSVASIQLAGGTLLQQNFLVTFNVDNPNDRALPVSSLHADLSVMGERVASGVSDRSFVVPARGSSQFDMTIRANMGLALLKLANRDRQSDDVDYDMTGSVSVDLPFLGDVPFRQHGSFSLKSWR